MLRFLEGNQDHYFYFSHIHPITRTWWTFLKLQFSVPWTYQTSLQVSDPYSVHSTESSSATGKWKIQIHESMMTTLNLELLVSFCTLSVNLTRLFLFTCWRKTNYLCDFFTPCETNMLPIVSGTNAVKFVFPRYYLFWARSHLTLSQFYPFLNISRLQSGIDRLHINLVQCSIDILYT
jgi:hypothetical protein